MMSRDKRTEVTVVDGSINREVNDKSMRHKHSVRAILVSTWALHGMSSGAIGLKSLPRNV